VTVYLDCNATTPIEPRVRDEVLRYLEEEFGNAGSRTHEYGVRAKQAVQLARELVASVVKAEPEGVVFTSGATESNNLAILGLACLGEESGKKHVISTQIEHKAVLEPLGELERRGFEVDLVPPTNNGWVDPQEIARRLKPTTLLVSVMHVNNETGVVQPLEGIVDLLKDHPAYLHVDAAQGFGKSLIPLQTKRIDLTSVSGHKIYGPKGVGALITRRRGYARIPLKPLMHGGGQERGLRPGTLPVPLVVGFGLASDLALREFKERAESCTRYRQQVLAAFNPFRPRFNGDQSRTLQHVVNLALPGVDSEAVMLALKDLIAISNGSACTSQSYEPSHVLRAMQLPEPAIRGALRISWCHMTKDVAWDQVQTRLRHLFQ
jgi:cysteine desulfurase